MCNAPLYPDTHMRTFAAVSKSLVRRAAHRSTSSLLFFICHLTPARQPLDSPMSANEWALQKNAAENEIKLHKQMAMRSRRTFNDARADRIFGNSCNTK